MTIISEKNSFTRRYISMISYKFSSINFHSFCRSVFFVFEQSFCVISVLKTNFFKDKVVTSKQIIHFYFFRTVKMKMLNVCRYEQSSPYFQDLHLHAHFPSPLQTKSFTFICIEFVLELWPCKACYKKVAT